MEIDLDWSTCEGLQTASAKDHVESDDVVDDSLLF